MGMREDIQALCEKNQFMAYIGMELAELEADRVVFQLTARPEHLNPYEMVHGGVMYTMADCASGTAARTDGRRYVTLSSSFNFIRSGMPGEILRAEAVVRHRGRSTCYVSASVTDKDGKLLSSGDFTFFCLDNK